MLLKISPELVSVKNHKGKTPLFLACEYGKLTMVTLLLQHQANVGFVHPAWGSIAQATAWSGVSEILKLVARGGAPVHASGGCYGNLLDTALGGCDGLTIVTALRLGAEVFLPREPLKMPAMGGRPALYPLSRGTMMQSSKKLPRDYREASDVESMDASPESAPPGLRFLLKRFPGASLSLLNRIHKATIRSCEILN